MIYTLMRLDSVLEIPIINDTLYFPQCLLLKLTVVGELDDLVKECLLAIC